MVDPDVLRAKTTAVRHHVARIRRRLPLSADTLDADEDLRDILLLNLQQAIQGCIDLAIHVCADENLGPAENPAAAFALLAGAGRIPADLSLRLASASGLRNLIVHRYGDLRTSQIVEGLDRDLADLERFVALFWRP
ncbi:MAG: DUF86 domain-containing protein [Deltaproteobacteria bacterium]|nr:DUF86 domain-containing protein [Deltaproteobacteria bacterium]